MGGCVKTQRNYVIQGRKMSTVGGCNCVVEQSYVVVLSRIARLRLSIEVPAKVRLQLIHGRILPLFPKFGHATWRWRHGYKVLQYVSRFYRLLLWYLFLSFLRLYKVNRFLDIAEYLR